MNVAIICKGEPTFSNLSPVCLDRVANSPCQTFFHTCVLIKQLWQATYIAGAFAAKLVQSAGFTDNDKEDVCATQTIGEIARELPEMR